jgi:hypothetical protein
VPIRQRIADLGLLTRLHPDSQRDREALRAGCGFFNQKSAIRNQK